MQSEGNARQMHSESHRNCSKQGFGLREFGSLLQNPLPGLDELVALANELDVNSKMAAGCGVVIVDTAPTGHTLRLLSLPKFLDGLLGKLFKIRMKLSGLVSTLQKATRYH